MISSLRVIGCLMAGAISLAACGGDAPPRELDPEPTAAAEGALLGAPNDTKNRYLVHVISHFDWRVAADPNAPSEHTREMCAGMLVGPRAIITDNHCIEGRSTWYVGTDGAAHQDGTPMVRTGHVKLEVWMHDITGAKIQIATLWPSSGSSPYYGEQVLATQDLAVIALPDAQALKLDRECQFQTQRLCARLPTWSTSSDQGTLVGTIGTAGQVAADMTDADHIVLATGQEWRNLRSFEQTYPNARVGNGWEWNSANYYTLPDKGHKGDCGGGPFQETGVFKDLLGVYRGNPTYSVGAVPGCNNCTAQVGYGTSFADPDVKSWVAAAVASTALVAPYNDGYFDGDPAPAGSTAPGFFACCGDGVCDSTRGENIARCPEDCHPQRCENVPDFEGSLTYADGSPGYCRKGGYNLAYKIDGADDHWAGGLNQPAYNWTSNDLSPVSAQLRFAGKFEWNAPNDRDPLLNSYNEILLKSVGERTFDMEFIRQWEFGWHAQKLNSLTELFAPLGSCGACIRVAYPVGTLADFNAVFGTNVPAGACERAGVWHEQIWISGGHLAFGAGAHSPCNDWATDRVGLGFLYEGPPYAGVRGGNVPTEAKFVYVFARDRRYLPAAPLCPERPFVSEDDPILMPIDPIPVPPGKIPLPGTDPPPSDMPK